MTTLSTQMPTPAPRPCSPAFAAVATQTIAHRDTAVTVTNRWLGGIRPEALDSGSYVSKRINPDRLPGGLT